MFWRRHGEAAGAARGRLGYRLTQGRHARPDTSRQLKRRLKAGSVQPLRQAGEGVGDPSVRRLGLRRRAADTRGDATLEALAGLPSRFQDVLDWPGLRGRNGNG